MIIYVDSCPTRPFLTLLVRLTQIFNHILEPSNWLLSFREIAAKSPTLLTRDPLRADLQYIDSKGMTQVSAMSVLL